MKKKNKVHSEEQNKTFSVSLIMTLTAKHILVQPLNK